MRVLTVAAALLAGLLSCSVAQAQTYPAKTVKIIVPYQAGQGTDVATRYFADQLSKALGQTFYVDNKPGAGGNIGTEAAAHSPADGYTLLMGTNGTQTMNEFLYASPGFRPGQGFHADHAGRPAADGDCGQPVLCRQLRGRAGRGGQGQARQGRRGTAQHDGAAGLRAPEGAYRRTAVRRALQGLGNGDSPK